ncbi:mycofactocin biosynthesis glycosyltransferase MftF [Nocardioides ultimimeridianus]
MTLPLGTRVRLAPATTVSADRSLVLGGSPLTALSLSRAGRTALTGRDLVVRDAASQHIAERLLATNLAQPDLDGVPAVAPEDLTVVLPVRDRADLLDRALTALRGLHCIVVDDASEQPRAIEEVADRHGARLVVLPGNLGPAGARNAGLDRVTTPFVVFVDSDVEVTPESLLRLTRHFTDPAVSVVGPRVAARTISRKPRWFEKYDAAAPSLALGREPGVVRPRAAVGWLPSACLVARTDVLRSDADGFAAALRVGEDVDLVWRLVDGGHRVRYDPTVAAFHATRTSARALLSRAFTYGTGGALLARRHGRAVAPAVLTPTYAAAGAAVLLRRRWGLPVALLCLANGTRSVRSRLPEAAERDRYAAGLAVRGLGWAVRQESSLLLRHWWPATAVALATSRTARRATATALVVDAAVALWESRHPDDRLRPDLLLLGRRLDDAAYGAGLWWGCLRHRTLIPLLPDKPLSEGRRPAAAYNS